MESPDFDRLVAAEARWLFKGKVSREAERLIILRDIAESSALHGWRRKFWSHLRAVLAVTGPLGWPIGRIIEGDVLNR